MSNILTRDMIVSIRDITVKLVTVPDTIPVWGGQSIYIRQLNRGQQDDYLKRQFGAIRMKQDRGAKNQELTSANIYGHDTWLCIQGMTDEAGIPLFTNADEKVLSSKSGEAIGWIASQIVEFSGMRQDIEAAKVLENLEEDVKN